MGKKGKGAQSKAAAKEEKRKKQEAKSLKKASKQSKGGRSKNKDKDEDEEDLDALLAEMRAQDTARTAVTVETSDAPSPRSGFSLCPLEGAHSSELLVMGGELFDGHSSECYNDVFRLNLEKLEWRKVSSPNMPDPRTAHQAVTVRDAVYVFGGEFSKGYQFHHYRDLWKLDLTKNAWSQVELRTGPSPRSGHRMLLWKHFIVLFGGFYETSRGFKFYDDLYFFDLREEKWHQGLLPGKAAQRPSARSGFQFCCHASKNTAFMYGGYAKVSVSSSAEHGRNLDDMWALHLTAPAKAGACPGFSWELLPKKGAAPAKRSGASSVVHKNRMVLFGGVTDEESEIDVKGQFYNSLHAFDMDRHKWFDLAVRKKKAKADKGKGKGKRAQQARSKKAQLAKEAHAGDGEQEDGDGDGDGDAGDDDDGDDDDADDNKDYYDYDDDLGLDDNAFYVIIDGKITKVELDDDDLLEDDELGDADGDAAAVDAATVDAAAVDAAAVDAAAVEAAAVEAEKLAPTLDAQSPLETTAPAPAPVPAPAPAPALAPIAPAAASEEEAEEEAEVANEAQEDALAQSAEHDAKGETVVSPASESEPEPQAALASATGQQAAPEPRIGARLAMVGSKLLVYGGTAEAGRKQFTFDDMWTVDLNQCEEWTCVFSGEWRDLKWRDDEAEDEDDDDDDDDDEDDEDDDDDDEEDDDDDDDEGTGQGEDPKQRALRVKGLREKLELGDEDRTPLPRELLRDFARRTREVWMTEALQEGQEERLSGKELRRIAFGKAERRFRALLPVLQELDELEDEQRLAEEMQAAAKDRLKDKLREKAKKRVANLAKLAKKEKRKETATKGAHGDDDDDDDSDDDE